jgi:hypothetical protein
MSFNVWSELTFVGLAMKEGWVQEELEKPKGQSLVISGIIEWIRLEQDIPEQEHVIQWGLETNRERLTSDKSWKSDWLMVRI